MATTSWKSLIKFSNERQTKRFLKFMRKKADLLSPEDTLKLYKRFCQLDKNGDGFLDTDEIHAIPGLEENPLVSRLVKLFDEDGNDSLDFIEFLKILSVFTDKNSDTDDKIALMFELFDEDGDGFISNLELYNLLHTMTGDHFNEIALQQVVDKTMIKVVGNPTGLISFAAYKEFVLKTEENLIEKLTISAF